MRHLNVVASVAAVIIVLAAFGAYYGLTALDNSTSFSSSSPSSSSPTSLTSASSTPSPCTVFQGSDGRITTTCSYSSSTSSCTLFLVSGGFTATASATSTGEVCEPLIGVVEVLGCPTATSSITVCSGPRYASFSASGTGTTASLCGVTGGSSGCTASPSTIGAAVPHDQRIEIDLFGALPTLRCTSSNCSSASLLSSVLDSCCRLADQYTFSAPGEYAFTASWTPVPFYLTACTFVSYSTATSAAPATSTPYCTSASGTVTATNFSTQQVTFVLNVS